MIKSKLSWHTMLSIVLTATGCAVVTPPPVSDAALPSSGKRPSVANTISPPRGGRPPVAERAVPPVQRSIASKPVPAPDHGVVKISQAGVAIDFVRGIPQPGLAPFRQGLLRELAQKSIKLSETSGYRMGVFAGLEPEQNGRRRMTLYLSLQDPAGKTVVEDSDTRVLPWPMPMWQWQEIGEQVAQRFSDKIPLPLR